MVECVHRAEGCMYTCQRQHLAKHLLDSCPYREVRDEDGESMPSKDALPRICEKEDGHHKDVVHEAVNKSVLLSSLQFSNLSR